MKVDRLISVIMILIDKERISAKKLAEMFEVSLRTIYRDIDAIDRAGIPIRSTSGVGGGFEIMPRYKIDRKVFSTTDLSTILMGLSSLSNIIRGDELINAFAKVKSFIPAERANDIEIKTNEIYIDLSPWMSNINIQPNLEIIKQAIQERKPISFEYIGHHGNKTIRTAEPYQLILKNSHWYFQGFCLKRNAFRLFKLCRISDLKIKEKIFIPREYQKPQLDVTNILSTMKIKIKIRIHKSIMDRVLGYCPYDNFTPDGNNHYIVNFPLIEKEYYYHILLSFGNKCECLEPIHVRQEMKQKIQELAAVYKK